jgi:hypothetical protein
MDRSLFLARLMGPTFVAIALGMLINLGMYESMIAEALHTGIVGPACCRCSRASLSSICTICGARTGASSSPFLAGL